MNLDKQTITNIHNVARIVGVMASLVDGWAQSAMISIEIHNTVKAEVDRVMEDILHGKH